jgi:RNA polymerase sigma-70 factor (ECF subfamily)
MSGAPERLGRAYQEHRPYLLDLAFRMLGDIGAAEDVVQDAFSRLLRAGIEQVEDERGWLIVVTSRLCLDQIRSARARRERAHDASEIEYVAPARAALPGSAGLADPADRVTFDDIAHTVGRAVPSCRQLARRARQKISAARGGARFDIVASEHRAVTERFIAACANGDLDGLLQVLAPDAWGDVDLGPDTAGVPPVTIGAAQVARNLLSFWGRPATLVSFSVGGQPALLGFHGRRLTAILALTVRGEIIQAVHVIGDQRKLGFLSSQLSGAR